MPSAFGASPEVITSTDALCEINSEKVVINAPDVVINSTSSTILGRAAPSQLLAPKSVLIGEGAEGSPSLSTVAIGSTSYQI